MSWHFFLPLFVGGLAVALLVMVLMEVGIAGQDDR